MGLVFGSVGFLELAEGLWHCVWVWLYDFCRLATVLCWDTFQWRSVGSSLNGCLLETWELLDTFASALSAFNFLEAFSRNVGPNNFPSRFSYFSSDSGFREGLILDQANFLRSTFIEWYVLPTIHRALCSCQAISSFVGLEVGFNKSHNKHVRRPVTSNNSSRRLYKQHSIPYCGSFRSGPLLLDLM